MNYCQYIFLTSLETAEKIGQAFEVSIDHLIHNTDGTLEEIKIEDQSLAERIKLLNKLDEEERKVINKVIDAMLTKKKMLEMLTKEEVVLR